MAAPAPAQALSQPTPPGVVAGSGKMQPVRAVKISPEVSGEIIELPVKEGQQVKKGDLLLRIKADFYLANRDQADGTYKSALAGVAIAQARLQEAEADLKRSLDLYRSKLVSDSGFEAVKTAEAVARGQLSSAQGQLEMARACLARAQYELDKTTVLSPISGTIAKLNSAVGERVVGTATMAGTEVMTLADLNDMEARVEVGEQEIELIARGQKVRLEINAFPGHSFEGTVMETATSSDGAGVPGEGGGREAARFEVRIQPRDKQAFRPGMSVTARILTLPGTAESTAPTANARARSQPWTG